MSTAQTIKLGIVIAAALAALVIEAVSPQNLWSIPFFVVMLGAGGSLAHD